MISNYKKGFTLIELLVVVAIIGILSSIVLASLSTARNKGQDASAKGSLSSARAAAELYFDEYNDYGSAAAGVQIAEADFGSGTTLADVPTNICEYDSIVNLASSAAEQVDSEVTCDVTIAPAGFTLYLDMNDDRVYCVDSGGYAGYLDSGVTDPLDPGVSCVIAP